MPDITDIIDRLPRDPHDPNWKVRALSRITRIVVHYDAVKVSRPKDGKISYDPIARYIEQARYHIGKDWNEGGSGQPVYGFGLMYHYRVSSDGHIWRTQPEELMTWHAHGANASGLAICCDLGPRQLPTQEQLSGLKALLNHLCEHRPDIPAGRPDVWGHCELKKAGNNTTCPGAILKWVQAYRQG